MENKKDLSPPPEGSGNVDENNWESPPQCTLVQMFDALCLLIKAQKMLEERIKVMEEELMFLENSIRENTTTKHGMEQLSYALSEWVDKYADWEKFADLREDEEVKCRIEADGTLKVQLENKEENDCDELVEKNGTAENTLAEFIDD